MKIQGSIALLLALVPGTIAFYPYTPTWMCNDGDCLVSDGETEVIIRDVASEVSQGISTLRIKKFSVSLFLNWNIQITNPPIEKVPNSLQQAWNHILQHADTVKQRSHRPRRH